MLAIAQTVIREALPVRRLGEVRIERYSTVKEADL